MEKIGYRCYCKSECCIDLRDGEGSFGGRCLRMLFFFGGIFKKRKISFVCYVSK